MQMPEVAEQALNLWPAGDEGAGAAVTLVAVAVALVSAAAAAVSEQAR